MQINSMPNTKTDSISLSHKIEDGNPHNLSNNAMFIINQYYKDNYILIQYVDENITHDSHELELGRLHVILHVGYKRNEETNIYIPMYRYDTFCYEHVIGKEALPEYYIVENDTKYNSVVNKEFFAKNRL